MFEYSNIRIPFKYSNTISEFEYSHFFYLSPRCASSNFSNEELKTRLERWTIKADNLPNGFHDVTVIGVLITITAIVTSCKLYNSLTRCCYNN